MKIAVAGTGYVGLSLAVLLAQHNQVTAVDIVPEKVDKLNHYISPIQDDYIEKYLKEAQEGTRKLDLTATTDGASAYKDADFVVIAAPTNYDPKKNYFDCSAVESVIDLVLKSSDTAMMVIKSTIPVGYTKSVREKYKTDKVAISFRKSEQVQVSDEQAFMDWAMKDGDSFLRYKEPEIDKAALKEAIKSGENIPYVTIVENNNIQIR